MTSASWPRDRGCGDRRAPNVAQSRHETVTTISTAGCGDVHSWARNPRVGRTRQNDTVSFATAAAVRRLASAVPGPLRAAAKQPLTPKLAGIAAWVAALALVSRLAIGYLTNAPDQRLADLDVYRTSGLSVLHGQPLYHMLTQVPQVLPFTYPPIAAVFAVPLALVSWPAAQLIWVAFIYVPLAVTIWYAFRPLLTRAGRYSPVAFAALFAMCAYLFPLRDQIRFGQIDILLVALCVADCATAKPRWPRGALIGLATAVKLVPGVSRR